ncbi:lysophospholipid acyltransferase family protein [soil metagenome]
MSYLKILLISIYALFIAVLTILASPFDKKGRITHQLSKSFSAVILSVAGIKLNIKGRELLDDNENYIFISNHQSYFDIPVLMQAIPNVVRFIYKDTMTRIPVFGWGMFLGQYIPISRTNPRLAITQLKKAAHKIYNGISVCIFPEGTRSEDGNIGDFKKGLFILADEAKVKLVPVSISGSFKILPKGKFNIRGGLVDVTFSEPLSYKKDKNFLEEIKTIISKKL